MKKFLLIVCILCFSGCNVFQGSHPRMAEVWPVYKIPDVPALNVPAGVLPGKSIELDAMIGNLYDTITYSESLRIIVEAHNKAAVAHNQTVEKELGIGQ